MTNQTDCAFEMHKARWKKLKKFVIDYVNYSGENKWTTVELEGDDATEEDAKLKAVEDDAGWGDGILLITGCSQA
jgi:hypothetical protein